MKRKIALMLVFAILSMVVAGCTVNNQTGVPTPSIQTNQTMPEVIAPSNPPATETTQPTVSTEPRNFDITLSFTGDTMLASSKNKTTSSNFNGHVNANPPEYFLEKVKHIFEADDFTIANLENVFTDKELPEREKDHNPAYWYYSHPSNVKILTTSSVECVSLANNHTYDYGEQGKIDTLQTVIDAGLKYGTNEDVMLLEKNGFKIAVICHGLWGEYQADAIIKIIKEAESYSDFQIVFYHGGTEKVHEPDQWRIRASHKLVDAGADLVIGNHPHVLQPREVYNGVEILYSLGNFCYGGNRQPENRTMIYQITLTIDAQTLQLENNNSTIIPCYVYTSEYNNYQPSPIEKQDEIDRVMQFINGKISSPI